MPTKNLSSTRKINGTSVRFQVLVRLKPSVLDVQGKAIERSLNEGEYACIEHIRVGKLIEFEVREQSVDKAQARVEELCRELLANTIIENYEIKTL